MFGCKGDDIILKDAGRHHHPQRRTGELMHELLQPGEKILIAKGGGDGGFGNLRFKSSINRAPRQKTPDTRASASAWRSNSRCWPTSACSACPTPASRP